MVWSTHVLIDCFNSYGTLVLWPFDGTRVAFNNLAIIDPLFTLPMLVTLVWIAFLRKPAQWPKRRRIHLIGLGIATAYAGLSFGAKAITSSGFEKDLSRQGVEYRDRFEAPTVFNILLWRCLVDDGENIWVGYRSLLGWIGSTHPLDPLPPRAVRQPTSSATCASWDLINHFSGDWWIARPHAKGIWIGDLRFGEMREWGQRKGMVDHRMMFSWDLVPARDRDRLRMTSRQRGDAGEMLKRAQQAGLRQS